MISPDLIPVLSAIQAGDKARARELLKSVLKLSPSAEAWYQASRITEKPEHEAQCLRRALGLDPLHVDARRRLRELEDAGVQAPVEEKSVLLASPPPAQKLAPDVVRPKKATARQKPLPDEGLAPLKKVRRQKKKRGAWFYVGIAAAAIGALTSTYFVLIFLGSPIPGMVLGVFTGERPVTEIDGVPLEQVEDAVMRVGPSRQAEISRSEPVSDALEPGLLHEYRFEARQGEEVAIGIQFFSPTAQRVNRNIAILDPAGRDAESRCVRDRILQGDNGAVMICEIHQSGTWRVRILGRTNESTGAYVVSVEKFR
jgi:hypothetical protein